jgi:CheY-like chemotaxis protein
VRIYLPRYPYDDKPAGVARPKRDAAHVIGNERILVVEDNDALRAYATEALRELGYHILEAHNGAAAVAILEAAPALDLLLTDIVMPGGMNGRQLADAARSRRPGLKVLFMTGYSGNAIGDRLEPGMQIIGKPFTIDGLVATVREMLESGDAD